MSEPEIHIARVAEEGASIPVSENAQSVESTEGRFLEYYGLNEQPFGVTPDPRFLYFGSKHRQALTALTYGTELNRGFLTLIAKPGMGKTSLLFQYLGGLQNKVRTAFMFQTIGDSRDLMNYVLTDLGFDVTRKDLPEMHTILNQVLMDEMRKGRRLVLVIDEAQNLDEKVLEFVRLLSNFETPWTKLMQIVLAGQPQLAEKLAQPSMAQLRQRVSFSIRIEPLNREEIDAYVDHRLGVAGYKGSSLFSVGARTLLAERSEGIPRNINNMCFCAMSLAWATKAKTVDLEMMRDVLADMDPGLPSETPAIPPKPVDAPRNITPQPARAPVITVEHLPARGWLMKGAIAAMVILGLSWSGIHFNLGQKLAFYVHDITAAVRSYVPPSTPAAIHAPAIPDGSHESSMGTNAEAPAQDKIPDVPLNRSADAPLPSRGSN